MSARRQVHFGTISIRRYDIQPGDSPSCSNGVPISLDWTYIVEQDPVDLRLYATMCPNDGLVQLSRKELRQKLLLSGKERWKRLRSSGFSKETLKEANPDAVRNDIRKRLLKAREMRLKDMEEAQHQPKNLPVVSENEKMVVAGMSA